MMMMKLPATSLILMLVIFQLETSDAESEYDRRQLIYMSQAKDRLVVGTFIHPQDPSVDSPPESIIECTIAGDSYRAEEILATHRDYPVLFLSESKLDRLIDRCAHRIRITITRMGSDHSNTMISPFDMLIAPGTKWCGPGNRSKSYDDLGPNAEIDMCCREHDYCPDYIMPHETKFNLTNKSFIVSSSCECDDKLKACLKEAAKKNFDAAVIGNVFFNLLKMQCFKKVKPQGKCLKYRGLPFFGRCARYAEPESDEEVYQFFKPEGFSH